MKIAIAILLLLGLVGCGGDSDSGASDNNDLNTPVQNKTAWGGLTCQKDLSCQNKVLNLNYQSLKDFIELQFPFDGKKTNNKDQTSVSCGRIFVKKWFDEFPQHQGAEFYDVQNIAKFGSEVLKIQECTNQPDVAKQMQNYLINTKEYQDEN